MINIKNLPLPDVLQILDYEDILNQNLANFKTLVPDWIPLESDEFKIILEAFALRELHLRAEHNILARAFFLLTATKADLDNWALRYGIERLKGSKPYALYEFKLNDIRSTDLLIPANFTLTDDTSSYTAKLLNDVTIKAGTNKASGVVELQSETKTSDIKTQTVTTSFPFLVEVKALEVFKNGSDDEKDDELKHRILLSMADKSTAGSEETYKSFTFKADERIEDVKIKNGIKPLKDYVSLFFEKSEVEILAALEELFSDMATVEVYYYSAYADDLMKTRIEEMLNKEEVRPLSDQVKVAAATQIDFIVSAELKVLPNQEVATVYTNALQSLNDGLESLKQIGSNITLSEINDFLKVTGVKEVIITTPSQNVVISDNEIGVSSAQSITYTII